VPPHDGALDIVDVGTGPNLIPFFCALPRAARLTAWEYAKSNVDWLQAELRRNEMRPQWRHFWAVTREACGPGYDLPADPIPLLRSKAKIEHGSIFDLPRRRWNAATMFFCAESITERQDEFEAACAAFAACVKPGGALIAAFLVHSAGYVVGDRPFPVPSLSPESIGGLPSPRKRRRGRADRHRRARNSQRLFRLYFLHRDGALTRASRARTGTPPLPQWAPRVSPSGRPYAMRPLLTALFIVTLGLIGAPHAARAATAAEIQHDANETLHSFVRQTGGARDLANKAVGILVFPSVIKAGIGIGGEYGEGMLIMDKRPAGYYNLISASFGFQLGAQERSVIIMFMTRTALDAFKRRAGWKIGVDGSVAIITLGAGGSIDTDQITQPVIGFILDQKGLMYNLTLEGSKISRINR
jgi:lipid-binding SYLF domain-containing protein